jgi:hypothetical protein
LLVFVDATPQKGEDVDSDGEIAEAIGGHCRTVEQRLSRCRKQVEQSADSHRKTPPGVCGMATPGEIVVIRRNAAVDRAGTAGDPSAIEAGGSTDPDDAGEPDTRVETSIGGREAVNGLS